MQFMFVSEFHRLLAATSTTSLILSLRLPMFPFAMASQCIFHSLPTAREGNVLSHSVHRGCMMSLHVFGPMVHPGGCDMWFVSWYILWVLSRGHGPSWGWSISGGVVCSMVCPWERCMVCLRGVKADPLWK